MLPAWLALILALETGYAYTAAGIDVAYYDSPGGALYAETSTEAVIRSAFVAGYIRSDFTYSRWSPNTGPSFSPFSAEYGVRGGFRWRGFEFGYRHYCRHPVLAQSSQAHIDHAARSLQIAETEVYARVEITVD